MATEEFYENLRLNCKSFEEDDKNYIIRSSSNGQIKRIFNQYGMVFSLSSKKCDVSSDRILWKYGHIAESGTPFAFKGETYLECSKETLRKTKLDSMNENDANCCNLTRVELLGCKASMTVTEIDFFPGFQVENSAQKCEMVKKLHAAMNEGHVETVKEYLFVVSKPEEHSHAVCSVDESEENKEIDKIIENTRRLQVVLKDVGKKKKVGSVASQKELLLSSLELSRRTEDAYSQDTSDEETSDVKSEKNVTPKKLKKKNTTEILQCSECDGIFISEQSLIKHKKEKHEMCEIKNRREFLKCLECSAIFTSNQELSAHNEEKHKKPATPKQTTKKIPSSLNTVLQCNECSSIFISQQGLLSHQEKKHKKKSGAQESPKTSGNKTHTELLKCPDCMSCFTSKQSLLTHKQEKHGGSHQEKKQKNVAPARENSKMNTVKNGSKLLNCSNCSSSFFSEPALLAHIRRKHNGTIHYCSKCSKAFKTEKEIMSHIREHHTKKLVNDVVKTSDFVNCPECNAVFASQQSLQAHIEVKHTISLEEAHKCPECAVTLKTAGELIIHKNEKHGKTPKEAFKCQLCRNEYVSKATCWTHMQRVHGISVEGNKYFAKCLEPMCGGEFISALKLQDHLSNFHGKEMNHKTSRFATVEDFQEWKKRYEAENNCRFYFKHGNGKSKEYYQCSVGRGRPKNQKRETVCTAGIVLTKHDGFCTTKSCFTHYGHSTESPEVSVGFQGADPRENGGLQETASLNPDSAPGTVEYLEGYDSANMVTLDMDEFSPEPFSTPVEYLEEEFQNFETVNMNGSHESTPYKDINSYREEVADICNSILSLVGRSNETELDAVKPVLETALNLLKNQSVEKTVVVNQPNNQYNIPKAVGKSDISKQLAPSLEKRTLEDENEVIIVSKRSRVN